MKTIEVSTLAELIAATPRRVKLIFIADVGATNTRVSFVPIQLSNTAITFFKAQAGSVADMIGLFEKAAAAAGEEITSRVAAAAVAVPGPVTENGTIAVVANFKANDTNGRTVRVRDLPSKLCPVGRTRLLNDLHACSAGIAGLNHIGAFGDAFIKMWGPPPAPGAALQDAAAGKARLDKSSVVVLAPGTGLGTALLHYDADGDRFMPVPLEFGHTHISTFEHGDLMNSLVKKLGRGNHPVEFDDVCTGRGLEHIYAHATNSKRKTAPEISKLASQGDVFAITSFTVMYSILMNLASQLAMGFVPGTVVIAGDNAVRHAFFLSKPQNVAALRDVFKAHTMERMGFMSRVQVVRQATEMNLNLIGAAFTASQMLAAAGRSKL